MKRNLMIFSVAAFAFAGISCEKHTWEDQVEVKVEKVYDDKGNVVGETENTEIHRKGAKRFFMEDHAKQVHTSNDAKKPAEGEH